MFSYAPFRLTLELRLAHLPPVVVQHFHVFVLHLSQLMRSCNVPVGMQNAVNAPVNSRYIGLMGLEIAVGLCRIKHRRDKKRMGVAAAKQSRICRKVTQLAAVRLNDEHPEHLASVGIGAQPIVSRDISLHLLCRQEAQRVRLIVERIGELARPWQVGM